VGKNTVAATRSSCKTSGSFQRAHSAFQLGQVSCTHKVLVVTVLFDVLEPVVIGDLKVVKN
jgi:hypothetical protein